MTATYNPALVSDCDWVRFLTGDKDTAKPFLQDEEINAVIAAENVSSPAVRYYASATALMVIKSGSAAQGAGVQSKTVGRLSISWGVSSTFDQRAQSLRMQGALLLTPSPQYLKVFG